MWGKVELGGADPHVDHLKLSNGDQAGEDGQQQQVERGRPVAQLHDGGAKNWNRENDDETNKQPELPVGHVVLITRSVVVVACHPDAWSPIPRYRCQPTGDFFSGPALVAHVDPLGQFAV